MFSLVAVAALALVSCGSKDAENKEGGPSVCDCVSEGKKGDKADKAIMEKCKKMGEGKSKEEMQKLVEEASKCK